MIDDGVGVRDLDPWKILWIRIRQDEADPMVPDPDLAPQHCFKLFFKYIFKTQSNGTQFSVHILNPNNIIKLFIVNLCINIKNNLIFKFNTYCRVQ